MCDLLFVCVCVCACLNVYKVKRFVKMNVGGRTTFSFDPRWKKSLIAFHALCVCPCVWIRACGALCVCVCALVRACVRLTWAVVRREVAAVAGRVGQV